MQDSIRDYIKFIIIFYLFIVIGKVTTYITKLIGINITSYGKIVLEVILSVITLIVVLVIYRKNLIEDLKKLKEYNIKKIIVIIIGILVGAYAVQITSGLIVILLSGILDLEISTSNNNELVLTMLKSAPVLMGIDAVLLGPFNEEGIFRLGFSEIIKNKKAFIAVSGITFGIMHVISSFYVYLTLPIIVVLISIILRCNNKKKVWLFITCIITYLIFVSLIYSISNHGFINFIHAIDLKEVLFSIEYISVGIYFAYIYNKYKNIYFSYSAHALLNLNSIFLSFN